MDNSTYGNNYLIIQTAFLGDVVLSLSMAEYIKTRDKGSRVILLTTKTGSPIAEECEFIDEVISYDKRGKDRGLSGIIKISKMLNEFNFKVVFTPHRSFRSSILTKLIKSKFKYGFDKNSISWLFSNRVKYKTDKHEIVRNLSLVRAYWGDNSDEIIKPKLNKSGLKNEYIIIAPGSVWNTKRWPEEKWAELILHPYMLDRKVTLIGAKGDVQTVEAILKKVDGKHPNLVNRTGQDDIKQTIEVIAQGKLLISNDSAPQHIAVAVDTPVITIYGSTVPGFGFYPVGNLDVIIETDEKLSCRPCTDHGKKECPIKTFDCMESIKTEQIIEAIQKIEMSTI